MKRPFREMGGRIMLTLKVQDLVNRLNEIGYDEDTELVFGCVDGDTGSWYQVPFDRICYGEEFTGHPYCKDVINIDVDIDSVKEYAKSKADGVVYKLVDDLRGVLRNYDILI